MPEPNSSNALRNERLLVAVVRLAEDGPCQFKGALVALDGGEATVRIAGGAKFAAEESVVLVRGTVGSRKFAPAAWVRSERGCDVFSLAAQFEPFDARRDPRFPIRLATEVRQGGECCPGVMLDVSQGGAAVAVHRRPEGQSLDLAISYRGFSARLPCQVVGISAAAGIPVLHLKFELVNSAERAFVRELVRDARAAAELADEAAA